MDDIKELTYSELYNLIGEALKKDSSLGDRKALVMIGRPKCCKMSTVKGLTKLSNNLDPEQVDIAIQGAWNNGKPVKED